MQVYAVTVTYGNRYKFVEKLIERLLQLDVMKVVIIDNDSSPESKNLLKTLADLYPLKIALISLSVNYGSAGGFKRGLIYAESQQDCEGIWLLDDDNLPDLKALEVLVSTYETLNENCCLVSLRKDRVPYRKIFNKKDVQRKFHPYNSFMNYNIIHGLRKKMLFSLEGEKSDLIPIPYGPYGGMFFHKKILSTIGYPNEEMYLYMDDHEFSHRIIKADLMIYLIRKSIIEDMEVSWHGLKKYRFFSKFMGVINGDETKTYYLFRNLMYFEKKYYVNNKVVYAINRFIYKFTFFTLCFILNKRNRIRLLQRAIDDSKKWFPIKT